MDFRDLLAGAKLPERTVVLCFRADLQAEHDRLEVELARALKEGVSSLGDSGKAKGISARIREVEAEMEEHSASFTFRALPRSKWVPLLAAHPPRDDKPERLFNADDFPAACVVASCVEPSLTAADVEQLFEVTSQGQRDTLFRAAWDVNTESADVPFSVRASALTQSSNE